MPDLRRLPAWAQYAIGLVVAGVVAGVALSSSAGDKGPGWLTDVAGPVLGVLAILAGAFLLVSRLRRRR